MEVGSRKPKNLRFGKEWFESAQDKLNYSDLIANVHWRRDWISFDGIGHHTGIYYMHCVISGFDPDSFKAYDRKAGRLADPEFKTEHVGD